MTAVESENKDLIRDFLDLAVNDQFFRRAEPRAVEDQQPSGRGMRPCSRLGESFPGDRRQSMGVFDSILTVVAFVPFSALALYNLFYIMHRTRQHREKLDAPSSLRIVDHGRETLVPKHWYRPGRGERHSADV